MLTKNNQHAQFFMLLSQMKGATKDKLVWHYSNMLTTSLNDFKAQKPADYERMISDMRKAVQAQNTAATDTFYQERKLKSLRSAVLLRLQKHGIDTTSWPTVNKFMRNPRIAGKTLGEMSVEELEMLIPKLESILTKDRADKVKKAVQLNIFSLN